MINPVQNVMVFGLLSAFQKEVGRERDRRDIRTENGKAQDEHHVETTQESNQGPVVRHRTKPNVGRPASHEPVEAVDRVVRQEEQEEQEEEHQNPDPDHGQEAAQHALEMIRANQVAEDVAHIARWHQAPEARRQQLDRATQFLVNAMRRHTDYYDEDIPEEDEERA
ncbi:hypothetical protein [Magnetococcus sp. PR-3]|uniref:hypothetical protein n=1 Tax=Magnetococcus sp. PR-3 TaxID=3120355 RepID=UPI002FCDF684